MNKWKWTALFRWPLLLLILGQVPQSYFLWSSWKISLISSTYFRITIGVLPCMFAEEAVRKCRGSTAIEEIAKELQWTCLTDVSFVLCWKSDRHCSSTELCRRKGKTNSPQRNCDSNCQKRALLPLVSTLKGQQGVVLHICRWPRQDSGKVKETE